MASVELYDLSPKTIPLRFVKFLQDEAGIDFKIAQELRDDLVKQKPFEIGFDSLHDAQQFAGLARIIGASCQVNE